MARVRPDGKAVRGKAASSWRRGPRRQRDRKRSVDRSVGGACCANGPGSGLSGNQQFDAPEINSAASIRLTNAFARGSEHGLVRPRFGKPCPRCLFGGVALLPSTSGRYVDTRLAWKGTTGPEERRTSPNWSGPQVEQRTPDS